MKRKNMNFGVWVTVIVLIVLTLIIFAFAFVVFQQLHKSEKILLVRGDRDPEIVADKDVSTTKSYKVWNVISTVFSYLLAGIGIAMMAFALYVRSQNGLYYFQGKSLMVVASNSMSAPYNLEKQTYLTSDRLTLEFNRGDILTLSEVPNQSAMESFKKKADGSLYTNDEGSYVNDYFYDVFAYENSATNGSYILHRLVYIGLATNDTTGESYYYYLFRGDANNISDNVRVKYADLHGLYATANKTAGVGYFILFFESLFGMYAVLSSLVMIALSSIYTSRIQKDYNTRWDHIDHSRLVVYEEVQSQQAFIDEKLFGIRHFRVDEMKDIQEKEPAPSQKVVAVEPVNNVPEATPEKEAPAAPAPKRVPEKEKPAEKAPEAKPVKKVFGKKGIVVKIVKSDDDDGGGN